MIKSARSLHILSVYPPCCCRHLTGLTGPFRRQTGTCRLPTCGKRRPRRRAASAWAGGLGAGADKGKDNRGRLLIALIPLSGRSSESPRQAARLRLSRRGAVSVHCGLTGMRAFSPFAGFAALHYCDLSYKSFQSRSTCRSELRSTMARMAAASGRLRRCHLPWLRGVRW
jgi:hypothetical protein